MTWLDKIDDEYTVATKSSSSVDEKIISIQYNLI